MDPGAKLTEVTEERLISQLVAHFGRSAGDDVWAGDDAAVVSVGDATLLLTTDMLVEGIDFDLSYATGYDIGWKSLAVNVSDIAAMGGKALHAVVALAAPTHTSVDFLEEIARGLAAAAEKWSVDVVGGDFSRAPMLVVSLAVTGVPLTGKPVLRSGAAPGDSICVTGRLGGSAGGLIALRNRIVRETGDDAVTGLIERHLRPFARSGDAAVISDVGPSAMIDVSDGLARDLAHILDASGAGCDVHVDALPIDPRLDVLAQRLPGYFDPLELALTGGEDFELLFTIDPASVEVVCTRLADLGAPATMIGAVTSQGRMIGDDTLDTWKDRGWDHLQSL